MANTLDTSNLQTSGATAKTKDSLFIDSGALVKNFGLPTMKKIGATSGGNKFTEKITFRSPKIDGYKSKDIAGLKQIEDYEITLETNFIEMSEDVLKMAMIGDSDKTSYTNYNVLTSKMTLTDADYINNIALVGTISGTAKPVIIVLYNALCTSGLEIDCKDNNDNTLKATFTAHFSLTDNTTVPFKIYYPKPDFNIDSASVVSGNVVLQMSDDVALAPKDGFTVTVAGSADVVTASNIGTDTTQIVLALTTAPTAGQAIAISYTQPTDVSKQVSSANNVALNTFTAISILA